MAKPTDMQSRREYGPHERRLNAPALARCIGAKVFSAADYFDHDQVDMPCPQEDLRQNATDAPHALRYKMNERRGRTSAANYGRFGSTAVPRSAHGGCLHGAASIPRFRSGLIKKLRGLFELGAEPARIAIRRLDARLGCRGRYVTLQPPRPLAIIGNARLWSSALLTQCFQASVAFEFYSQLNGFTASG